MNFKTVLFEREACENGSIVLLTLNRPKVRNAINIDMVQDLGGAFDAIADDDSTRAIVITGMGEKAFAAGADIAELKERNAVDALLRINAAIFRRIEEQPLPVIAAIRGFALGGGCELAMACDLRIAGESARLGQPEVSLGILPGAGAVQRLPHLVGLGRAKELIFTGRILDAREAERIGLVNRVVPDDLVLVEAKALAFQIAAHGPLAIKISKLALNASGRTSSAFDVVDALGQAVLFDSEDKHRRMGAFLAKRSKKSPGSET